MLKEKINADFLIAFKSRQMDKKNFLGLIKGDIQTIEKNLTVQDLSDAEVIKILNKIAKNIKETLAAKETDDLKEQLTIVESYLPKLMSDADVKLEMQKMIASGANNIGAIMKLFADKPVDRKIVSQIAKELL